MLGLSHSPHIMKKLTQQIGDNEANIGELSPWSCKREIPEKGGKGVLGGKSSELT